MKYLKIYVLFVSVLGLVSCKSGGDNMKDKKNKMPVSVDVIIAEEEDLSNSIEVNGTVMSQEMVEFHPETGGRITFLNMPDGATVSQGTVLARINDADLQAELEQLNVELSLATKTEARYSKLLSANGIDQATYDLALSNLETLKAKIKVKNAQIDKLIIKAPFSGRLGLRQVSVGAYVTQATTIGTIQSEDVKIDFTVPENYKNMVKPGTKVKIFVSESDSALTATVAAVEPQINVNTRNYKVRARLEKGNLNPGAFVKVALTENKKSIIVPTNAVIPDAMSNQVIVVKEGKGEFVNVETGIRTANALEITGGIAAGDSIVVSGVLFVRPSAKVKVDKVLKISDIINKKIQ